MSVSANRAEAGPRALTEAELRRVAGGDIELPPEMVQEMQEVAQRRGGAAPDLYDAFALVVQAFQRGRR